MPVFSRADVHVLFVHVPKTGGTALEDSFERAGFTTTYRDHTPAGTGHGVVRRCSLQHLHAPLLAELFRLDRFTATFAGVRDPFRRFQSEFAFRRGAGRAGTTTGEDVERWGRRKLRQAVADPSVNDNHFRPQWEFVPPSATVFRHEDGLHAVTATLGRDLGVDLPAPRVRNTSAHRGLRSSEVPLTSAMRALVLERYERDFAEFGYPREPDGRTTR